jgi:hypothetical protein
MLAYLIFMCWDVVGIIVIYLFVVETKRLSLEDMDSVFEAKNPKKRSFELARAAKESRRWIGRGQEVDWERRCLRRVVRVAHGGRWERAAQLVRDCRCEEWQNETLQRT